MEAASPLLEPAPAPLEVAPPAPPARLSDSELTAALCEMAKLLGRSPRTTELGELNRLLSSGAAARGTERVLPAYSTYIRRFGSFDQALVAAGLPAHGGRKTRDNRRPAKRALFDDAAIADTLRAAHRDVGEPFNVQAFRRWRQEELARRGAAGTSRRLPSYGTIIERLGGWPAAAEVARGGSLPAADGERAGAPSTGR